MALGIDFFLYLTVFLLQVFAIVIFNLYLIAHYAHPEDSAFGRSKLVKAFVILSYSTNFILVLMVPLDVFMSKMSDPAVATYTKGENNSINILWLFISFSTITMVFIALPVMILFYESNER